MSDETTFDVNVKKITVKKRPIDSWIPFGRRGYSTREWLRSAVMTYDTVH